MKPVWSEQSVLLCGEVKGGGRFSKMKERFSHLDDLNY